MPFTVAAKETGGQQDEAHCGGFGGWCGGGEIGEIGGDARLIEVNRCGVTLLGEHQFR